MGLPDIQIVVALFLAFLGFHCYLLAKTTGRDASRFPGPPSLPLIGNIWRLNPKRAWLELTSLKEKHGDIIYYHGLGNSVLVLNSIDAIKDLLEKRNNTYSDRPVFTVVGDMMGLGQSMPLLPNGPEWRACRKLAHLALSPSAVTKYHHIQEELTVLLLKEILDAPGEFNSHVRLIAGRIILTLTYGLSVKDADDNYITDAEKTMKMIGEAVVPGAFVADLLPILKHFTFLPFHKEAAKGRDMIENLVSKPMAHVHREMTSGIAPKSLTRDLLEQDFEDRETHEHRVKWTSGSLYGAGAETVSQHAIALFSGLREDNQTYTTVLVFILAMAMYPDVQRKAQKEVSSRVSSTRLPKLAEVRDLPYLEAVVKECLRWRPALPLGLARSTATDDIYNGYFIPKGTVVMPNAWALAFTPNAEYDPQEFIPERFLDESQDILDPMTYAFGFGRRICPGKALAENSIYIILANLLAAFNILPPEDGIRPPEFGPNLISYPEPFECRLVPKPGMDQVVRMSAAESSI
ncbi:hypothetical protein NP233_g1185 [Leucocoprinus birnbaumii]|uniref:Cytochrome P450 n=1 Tax=Leucocoprinus birnbaumii TaxID=56174 RepID=A0AAD5W341_9AGAR|nr:hypothetical protein NP233_g1185 [Leucocoprinus birnbaumii]